MCRSGGPADGSPRPAADKLKGLGTNDGKALLFNIHLSGVAKRPVEFPDTQLGLPDEYAQMLFEISSVLPPKLRDEARREGFTTTESSRGFAFNADLRSLVQFLDIGTRTADLR